MGTLSKGNKIEVAIVVPTYNESKNIEELFLQIKKSTKKISDANFELFIIDDKSPDDTIRVAKKIYQKYEQKNLKIILLTKEKREGLGGAYVWGFKKILKLNKFDYAIQMDADLSHNPIYIEKFVDIARKGSKIVIGSRYIPGGSTPNWSFKRKMLSRLGNIYIMLFLGSKISDWTGGFSMYSTEILKKISLDDMPNGYSFQLTLKRKALSITKEAVQVPIIFKDRIEGESKIPRDTIKNTLILVPKLWYLDKLKNTLKLKIALIATSALLIGIITALLFLWSAGSKNGINWPISFELYNMDQPLLFNISKSIFEHHNVLFSSSGQSFMFLELPISMISYLLSSANVYSYYIFVASINNIIFYVLIFLLVSKIFIKDSLLKKFIRSLMAVSPLLIFMLITNGLDIYLLHIAPDYNFDLIIGSLIVPLILLSGGSIEKNIYSLIYVLVASSNLLVLLFSIPILVVISMLIYFKSDLTKAGRFLFRFFILSIVALIINYFLFKIKHSSWPFSIYSTGADTYFNLNGVPNRLRTVIAIFRPLKDLYWAQLISVTSILICLGLLIVNIKKFINSKKDDDIIAISRLYILFWPFLGVAFCYIISIIYDWYCWPLVVGSVVVAIFIGIPSKYLERLAILFLGLIFLVLLLGHFVDKNNFSLSKRIEFAKKIYFKHEYSDISCIEKNIPSNSAIYTTSSTGKVLSSQMPASYNFIEVDAYYNLNGWLNDLNKNKYVKSIHYAYLNSSDRITLDQFRRGTLTKFGSPNHIFYCDKDGSLSGHSEIWQYEKNILQ